MGLLPPRPMSSPDSRQTDEERNRVRRHYRTVSTNDGRAIYHASLHTLSVVASVRSGLAPVALQIQQTRRTRACDLLWTARPSADLGRTDMILGADENRSITGR